uniref:Slc7a-3 n=1 Tax=Schmidtea mediterranea TaxID=79327 RepID=A0A0H3YF62_SCHMD|nr:slc7a-3 [Schmidtea mediterranea]
MHTVQVGQERSFIFFMSYVLHSFLHSITRRRSFSQSKSLETKLNRCLSTSQLIFYGISHMIGAGIYVLTGHIIKDRVGSATNLSFLFSGLISIFTGLCYCEFSTLIPKAGSCYTYTYLMMGELPAFIVGWTMILDSIVSLASVSKGFSGAVNILCNDAVKNFTDKYLPLSKSSDVWESSADVLAFALLFTLFLITLTGANISMNINLVLSTIQLIFLSVIIIYCFVYGSHQNFVSDGGYLPFGFGSIFQGAGIAIFAYSGFECLANSAEETKNPRKSIPVALFVSLGIIILLYVLASSGLSFMVPRLQIDQKAPFIAAFSNRNLFALKWITGIATLLATGATKLAVFYVIPRMIYTMAEDGLIFKFLGKIDERSKIPIYAVLVGLFFSSLLAIFIKIQVLADITSMGIILSFITIGIDLIILRYIFDENNENTIDNSQKLPMRINTNSMICTRKFFKISLFSLIISIILTGVSILFILPISQITGIIFSAIFILLILTFTIIISLYEPTDVKDTFKTPLMPLTPIITICLNICLLMNLPGSTWLRFLVLTVIGLLIYFFYGIPNSHLSEKAEEKTELILLDNNNDEILKQE